MRNGMPLFLNTTIGLEKVAFDIRIDDDPAQWPVAVVREAYKQLPFLKAYETEVELERVDHARGYGVGKLLVWPPKIEKVAAAEAKQMVVIPIVIRGKDMAPLDVYSHQGHMLPMDQDKVAAILFRPETFHGAAPAGKFTDTQLNTSPPNTDHQYNSGNLQKLSSVITAVAPYMSRSDIVAFAERVNTDPGLNRAYATTPALNEAANALLGVTQKTASDILSESLAAEEPTAIQFRSSGTRFKVKTASRHGYSPAEREATAAEVSELLPTEKYKQLREQGRLTLALDPVEPSKVKVASEATGFGRYRTYIGARPVEGLVIPRVVDFDGRQLDWGLFIGDDFHGLQEKIASIRVGDAELPDVRPSGLGVFAYADGEKALATEPVRVLSHVKVAYDNAPMDSYVAVRMRDGSHITIVRVEGLHKISSVAGDVAIPAEMKFVPLRGKQMALLDDSTVVAELEMKKVASSDRVEVLSDGASWAFRGRNAAVFSDQDMGIVDAEFALAALGIKDFGVLKTASRHGSVFLNDTHRVVASEARAASTLRKMAAAASSAAGIPKADCVREIAILTSVEAEALWKTAGINLPKETADAVLSLGFITPENASIYVNFLPELEKTAEKLAELLVASRLGFDDVRESAARNAMTQVNAVIRGLEILKEKIS